MKLRHCPLVSRPGGLRAVLLVLLLAAACTAPALVRSDELPYHRAKLDRLLECQEAEKAGILKEQRRVLAHLREIEAFRATMTDAHRYRESIAKAEQAMAKDRGALAKIDEHLALVNRRIGLTVRAIQNLAPEQGGPAQSSSAEARRSAITRLANALRCTDPEAPDLRDVSRLKLLATGDDVCSRRFDELSGEEYGFLNDPVLHGRLETIVAHLQVRSNGTNAPVAVRILRECSGLGGGAFSTATTIYVDQCYLKQRPSDDELTFVFAHELAHVQLQHVNLAYLHVTSDTAIRGEPSSTEAIADYTRDQELEADLLGAELALAAGASPVGIRDALWRIAAERDEMERNRLRSMNEKQRKLYESDIARIGHDRLTASHPGPEDRLKALESVLGSRFWELDAAVPSSTCR